MSLIEINIKVLPPCFFIHALQTIGNQLKAGMIGATSPCVVSPAARASSNASAAVSWTILWLIST